MLVQEPLLKIEYTYICDMCHKSYSGKQKATPYIDDDGLEKNVCKNCVKEIISGRLGTMHQGKIYSTSHHNVHCCTNCGKICYSEESDSGYWYCPGCIASSYHGYTYCPLCKKMHEMPLGICDGGLINELSKIKQDRYIKFQEHKDSKAREPKGTVKYRGAYDNILKQLPFQEERNLPKDYVYDLDDFYYYESEDEYHEGEHYITNYYYREPVEITGEIEYKRYDGLKKFSDKMKDIDLLEDSSIKAGHKQNKYRNHFFKDISDDGLIVWKHVDLMGNVKEKKESINKFFESNGMDLDKVSLSRKVYYRLSSDLDHKAKSFRANSRFGSCQQDHNCKTYASGAYDAITNGCNCPILLYNKEEDMYVRAEDEDDNKGKPIGRITSRLMYDKDGKMYILIDRLYQDGSLSSDILKGNIYKSIILDLKNKGYNVIVTNYSAHDESTLQYIKALGINNTEVVRDLYQPLRILSDVEGEYGTCGYYSDGGVEVLGVIINDLKRATDYLDKAYLIK